MLHQTLTHQNFFPVSLTIPVACTVTLLVFATEGPLPSYMCTRARHMHARIDANSVAQSSESGYEMVCKVTTMKACGPPADAILASADGEDKPGKHSNHFVSKRFTRTQMLDSHDCVSCRGIERKVSRVHGVCVWCVCT
jgi:hypothetical protein